MKSLYVSTLVLAVAITACEQPNSPDFKVNQQIQTPLISERSFQFMGESGALIDSTNPDFETLFSSDGDKLITLSKEQDFNFESLDDAIPEILVDPQMVQSSVGPIEIDNFSSSSSGNYGQAGFEDVTGEDPNTIITPFPLPADQKTVTINLDTDYLNSATLSSNGSLALTIVNDMGFDVDVMEVTIIGDGQNLDTDVLSNSPLADGSSEVFNFNFAPGDVLSDLKAEVYVEWESQTVNDPGPLTVSELQVQNIVASQVDAKIPSQTFDASGSVNIDNANFQFNQQDHYIEIESGELVLQSITNQISLYIDPLTITFPDIRSGPNFTQPLTITFQGSNRIPAGGTINNYPAIDLSGMRIYAQGDQIDYDITGTTENTQSDGSDDYRTITENDQVEANVEINNLNIAEANGYIVPKNVVVNNDADSNGEVDLFNDNEAEIVTIDALSDLSDQLSGIQFADPKLSINYTSNIGVATTIYAGILGLDAAGNKVYLRGLDGQPYHVQNTLTELTSNGSPLAGDKLIKFDIPAASGGSTQGSVLFDKTTTNVDDFLNNLPSDIRFVSVAKVNSNGQEGTITDPVEFDPSMAIEIPLNFSASSASYTDTTKADLSDLPDPEKGDQALTDGKIYVEYTNNLPLGAELDLSLIDENGNGIELSSDPSNDPLKGLAIGAGSVDSQTGYVAEANKGNITISLERSQLNKFNRTRKIEFVITMNTDSQDPVKLKSTDTISFRVSLSAGLESTVN